MNYYEVDQGFINDIFIYVDCKKHLADDLFISNKLKVKFIEEFKCLDTDYVLMLVKVLDRNSYLFVKAMEELKDRMIERGYEEYEEVCSKILTDSMKKKVKNCID